MPRYDVRNDGVGPYAAFYCDKCSREYRSQPDIKGTIAKDVGKQALGGFLRNIPLVGSAAANTLDRQDPRYIYSLTPQQLESAWTQVRENFHECPTCKQIVCTSDFDMQSGYCSEDSPRRGQIAQAQAEQAAGVMKGFAGALGLGDALRNVSEAAKRASQTAARCPKDGTLAQPGTKFCPNCGTAMIQPSVDACPKCGAETAGAKFCPNCGTKIERAAAASVCPNCGADAKGAKFCPECGTQLA
jgi:uncharacterized OB-fold protein